MTGDQARFLNIGDRVCGRRIKPIKAPSVKERRGDGGRPAAHAGDANLVRQHRLGVQHAVAIVEVIHGELGR